MSLFDGQLDFQDTSITVHTARLHTNQSQEASVRFQLTIMVQHLLFGMNVFEVVLTENRQNRCKIN